MVVLFSATVPSQVHCAQLSLTSSGLLLHVYLLHSVFSYATAVGQLCPAAPGGVLAGLGRV